MNIVLKYIVKSSCRMKSTFVVILGDVKDDGQVLVDGRGERLKSVMSHITAVEADKSIVSHESGTLRELCQQWYYPGAP